MNFPGLRFFLTIFLVVQMLAAPAWSFDLQTTPFAVTLSAPVGVAHAGDDRLFIIEKAGRIVIAESTGHLVDSAFLDISAQVITAGENGLLGLAFHPQYAANGYFYVHYVNADPLESRLSRFSVSSDPNAASADTEQVLLTVPQFGNVHRGGRIFFGSDGYLYLPLGDGGIYQTGRNPTSLNGGIARIDVDSNAPGAAECFGAGSGAYAVPTSVNAYADGSGKLCDELWLIGVRNPWQTGYDAETNQVFVADVGESSWEELNVIAADQSGRINLGWACYEAQALAFQNQCDQSQAYTFPDIAYPHADGDCSIIGGAVYRGTRFPEMAGRYFFGDFCTGKIWSIDASGIPSVSLIDHGSLFDFAQLAAFGQDSAGRLYAVNRLGSVNLIEIAGTPRPDDLFESNFEPP